MNISSINLLRLAAIFFCLPACCIAFHYSEIQKWNASCSPKDTCRIPRDLDDSDIHNCDCSSLCMLYDTCCIDAQFLNVTFQHERRHTASCRHTLSTDHSEENVFMIDECSPSYSGPLGIRRKCEQNAKDWSDPFNSVPVTNAASQKTYKSLFCAICNGEKARNLTMWKIAMDCSMLSDFMKVCHDNKEFVINNMIYIPEKGQWGIWSWDSKSDWKFKYLSMTFQLPSSLKHSVKECRPDLISRCASNWTDKKIKSLCETYMGAVYFQDKAYRNVHCALCNHVRDVENRSCHEVIASPFRGATALSFGFLLDIDLRDGDTVGKMDTKCEEEQVYDPFSKKCRSIECPLPGYTLKKGQCVLESETR